MNDLEITSLIVLCKLTDGTIRSINTGRQTELEILRTINSYSDGKFSVSDKPITGIDIEMPKGFKSLSKSL